MHRHFSTQLAAHRLERLPLRMHQRGAAAIEFGLMFIVLMLLLAAVVSYGALFWAQQRLSQAAGDGARTAQAWLNDYWRDGGVNSPAYKWPFLGDDFGQSSPANRLQLCQRVVAAAGLDGLSVSDCSAGPVSAGVPCGAGAGTTICVPYAVGLSFDSREWPLLAVLRGMAGMFGGQAGCADGQGSCWIPDTLRARATVTLRLDRP